MVRDCRGCRGGPLWPPWIEASKQGGHRGPPLQISGARLGSRDAELLQELLVVGDLQLPLPLQDQRALDLSHLLLQEARAGLLAIGGVLLRVPPLAVGDLEE